MNNISMNDITKQLKPKGTPYKINIYSMIVIVLVVALVFIEGVGVIYFANKSRGFEKKLQNLEPLKKVKTDFQKLTAEEKGLQDKYNKLKERYRSAEEDRANIMIRVKALLAFETTAKELEAMVKKAEEDKLLLRDEIAQLNEKGIESEGRIEQLHIELARTSEERDGLKALYRKAKSDVAVRKLREQLITSRKETKKIQANLKATGNEINNFKKKLSAADKNIAKLSKDMVKLKSKKNILMADLQQAQQGYKQAVKMNKELEKHIRNLPTKFSEVAKQNKKLLSQTSKMHYNLGVFFASNKEYSRAVTEYKKSIEINPNDSYSHFNLGYIYAEYLVNRKKAIEHFRYYLRLAKSTDEDVDWVRKYLITWEAFGGHRPLK